MKLGTVFVHVYDVLLILLLKQGLLVLRLVKPTEARGSSNTVSKVKTFTVHSSDDKPQLLTYLTKTEGLLIYLDVMISGFYFANLKTKSEQNPE